MFGIIRRPPSNTMMRHLVREIHGEVVRLTAADLTLLMPHEGDSETVHLRLRMEGDVGIIDKREWDDTYKRYSVEACGIIRRSVFSANELTREDYAWCHQPLTKARLEYLLQALQSMYSPRRSFAPF